MMPYREYLTDEKKTVSEAQAWDIIHNSREYHHISNLEQSLGLNIRYMISRKLWRLEDRIDQRGRFSYMLRNIISRLASIEYNSINQRKINSLGLARLPGIKYIESDKWEINISYWRESKLEDYITIDDAKRLQAELDKIEIPC